MPLSIESVATRYRNLRCHHLAAELAPLLARSEANEVSYLEFANDLAAHEQTQRDSRRIQLNLRKAGFPLPKQLEEFDYRHQTKVLPIVQTKISRN